jgi:hypothetical protein
VQKYNENVFTNTLSTTFISKAMDINHQSFSPSYKHLNDSSKITSLHFIIHLKKDTLVELCASSYVTYDGLVNPIDGI